MDNILNYIHQNPIITAVVASILLFLAGVAARHFKIVAFIFILIAAFAFYTLLRDDKTGKVKIDELKQKAKEKVMENIK